MTRTWLTRAALSMLIGWGVWAGLARAEGPNYYPRTPPGAQELPPGYPPIDSTPSRQPIRDWLSNGRPLGCWASFNGYSCGSLRSELGFMFGSCRTFYGEPCLKGAPPSPLPPWAGPVSGYPQYQNYPPYDGSGAPAKPRCGCW